MRRHIEALYRSGEGSRVVIAELWNKRPSQCRKVGFDRVASLMLHPPRHRRCSSSGSSILQRSDILSQVDHHLPTTPSCMLFFIVPSPSQHVPTRMHLAPESWKTRLWKRSAASWCLSRRKRPSTGGVLDVEMLLVNMEALDEVEVLEDGEMLIKVGVLLIEVMLLLGVEVLLDDKKVLANVVLLGRVLVPIEVSEDARCCLSTIIGVAGGRGNIY
ncbi:hypothetical protein BDQ12DRAFT_693173 [Crucibulum laeve]|uniref:Uncharacterized protein n=1 Tax=Crucibulum laeve TaxID=68775 RepID=A0A5C3LGS9_9AGAR|nr:hypothetical protein BDQ12DRAFT_693173 [Crucibulum laeve]